MNFFKTLLMRYFVHFSLIQIADYSKKIMNLKYVLLCYANKKVVDCIDLK